MTIRAVLYISDIRFITGKSQAQCKRDFAKIKQHFGIEKVNYISVTQYSEFTKVPEASVYKVLEKLDKGKLT